jgi:hypothetical protein
MIYWTKRFQWLLKLMLSHNSLIYHQRFFGARENGVFLALDE